MIRLTVYSRPGCHLCDDMLSVIDAVGVSTPLEVKVVDISADEHLERLYGLEIPVLMIDGHKVAKYRVSETGLRRLLMGREEMREM